MKNKIALTAIFAVLTTNVAFADHTFEPNDRYGDCKSPDILETAGTLAETNPDPVQYEANWTNKIYTIQFTNTNGTGGTRENASCTYYDAADMANDRITKLSCDLADTGPMYKQGYLLTGWTTKSSDPTNLTLSNAAPLNTLSNADITDADGNSDTVVLDAVYTTCQYQYGNGTETKPDYITISASNTTNVCQYTVSCAAGYGLKTDTNYGANGVYTYNTYDTTNTNTLLVKIPADVCIGNTINLKWDGNGGAMNGESIKTDTCVYGEANGIDVPTPTRLGYTFEGWDIVAE